MHLSGVNPKGGFSKIMYNQAYRPNTNAYGYPMYSPGPGPTQPIAPMGATIPSGSTLPGMSPQSQAAHGLLPLEQSFIENILRLNLGKVATIYMTFENNSEWNAKVFRVAWKPPAATTSSSATRPQACGTCSSWLTSTTSPSTKNLITRIRSEEARPADKADSLKKTYMVKPETADPLFGGIPLFLYFRRHDCQIDQIPIPFSNRLNIAGS